MMSRWVRTALAGALALSATTGQADEVTVKMEAALVSTSRDDTRSTGNVRWGEAWFRDDFILPGDGLRTVTTADDGRARFRTTGHVFMPNGNHADGTFTGRLDPLARNAPNRERPWAESLPDHGNIHQQADAESIEWPSPLDYRTWRDAARERGGLYVWNEDRDALIHEASGRQMTPAELFEAINQHDDVVTGSDGDSQTLPRPTVVFIDTLNGRRPAGDGGNLCDFSLTGGVIGNSFFFRGVLWVGGNVTIDVNGADDVWLQDPDRIEDAEQGREAHVENLFLSGVLFAAGQIDFDCSPTAHGSVFAQRGIGGPGHVTVHYDSRLDDGFDIPEAPLPEIDVALDRLDFGTWPSNTTHNPAIPVTIINFGAGDLIFVGDGAVISGRSAEDFSFLEEPDLSPVRPESTRTLWVTFDPTAVGQREAQLAIWTTDADESQVTVRLRGEGGDAVSLAGLQNREVLNRLLGENNLRIDLNMDGREDVSDAVLNQRITTE
jgi:hypothetical protein